MIDEPEQIDMICAQVVDEFEVALDVCCTEVETFLNALVTHGAIALDPPPAGSVRSDRQS